MNVPEQIGRWLLSLAPATATEREYERVRDGLPDHEDQAREIVGAILGFGDPEWVCGNADCTETGRVVEEPDRYHVCEYCGESLVKESEENK
jgi:hypothetical protein